MLLPVCSLGPPVLQDKPLRPQRLLQALEQPWDVTPLSLVGENTVSSACHSGGHVPGWPGHVRVAGMSGPAWVLSPGLHGGLPGRGGPSEPMSGRHL